MDIPALLLSVIPAKRIKSSLIDLVAYASDAGFYHLRPLAVILPVSEKEIVDILNFSRQYRIPVVFRTAGTSLSGQAITDGILVDLSQYWDKINVEDNGKLVRVQPGAIGAIVNAHLSRYGSKLGPDPASINSAMMGGIISNNASGMCCGVRNNSYHTIEYISFILPGGQSYSTEDAQAYDRFKRECPSLFQHLEDTRLQIMESPDIHDKIRSKYRTKNTVGYGMNAFIDFEHPLDIMAHLMIGAEGTLGFISEAVMRTVPDYALKSTALIYFEDVSAACRAIEPLNLSGVEAVELMDRASLRSIENIKGIPDIIRSLPETSAALLIEYQSDNAQDLQTKVGRFLTIAPELELLEPVRFTTADIERALLWKVRKGMFPAVGAVRASGTTVILEDVAVPVARLGEAILDLQRLFRKYGYDRAIIFGHAKDGNIHFVITQAFDTETDVNRYRDFLDEVVGLVVKKYDGALKAEHGTGRNMAPFVETEWGPEIYKLMRSVKETVDPDNLINPGVIINQDPQVHIRNLKKLPEVEEEVDRCIECGFCEHKCPSRNITLTPRKRIVVRRELLQLRNSGKKKEYQTLLEQYRYQGLDTCAVDGLCATACPVDINTGDLVKRLRRESHSLLANRMALAIAKNFKVTTEMIRLALSVGGLINGVFGKSSMHGLTKMVKRIVPSFPLWSDQLARAKRLKGRAFSTADGKQNVVYFPTCISRVMGEVGQKDKGVMQTFLDVSAKSGINVVIPEWIGKDCCGQIYSSKGFKDAYAFAVNRTVGRLWEATAHGKYPVVLDISSCTQTLSNCRNALTGANRVKYDAMRILDSIEYLYDIVMPRVAVARKKDHIVLHPVCSLQKMEGLEAKFAGLAAHFSNKVTRPMFSGCCGMAGDRGFLFPELTLSATLPEAMEVGKLVCDGYYSSSKTCEIAMSGRCRQKLSFHFKVGRRMF